MVLFGHQDWCWIVFRQHQADMPEQINGTVELETLKEHLTQESYRLRGSEKHRYHFSLLSFQGTETTGSWCSSQRCARKDLVFFHHFSDSL